MKRAALFTAILFAALLLFGCGRINGSPTPQGELSPTSYHVTADLLPGEHALNVTTEITYFSPAEDLSAVKFYLYPNAYKEGRAVVTEDKKQAAYPHGKENYGGAEVLSVESNLPVADSDIGQDSLILTVRLGQKLQKGDRVSFKITERVTLANVKHRLGYYDGYYLLSGFYPEVCPFSGGKFLT